MSDVNQTPADKPAKKTEDAAAKAGPRKEGKSSLRKEAPSAATTAPVGTPAPAVAAAAPARKDGEAAAAPAAPESREGAAGQPKTQQQILAEILGEETGVLKVRKAKGAKNISSGQAHITATFNNTFVTITDLKGQVISWSSAGKCGFRGSRKSTAYAAQVVAQDAARNGMAHGLKEITIYVKGPGLGRDSAIRALQATGLEILSVVDVTPVPHNGCRPRKRRRV